MAFFNFFTIVLLFYAILYVLKCYHKLGWLKAAGVEVSLCQVRWFTQRYNRVFSRIGTCHRRALLLWFNFGSVISVLLVIPSMILLVRTLVGNITWLFQDGSTQVSSASDDTFVLQPVLPGLNMPLSKSGHYILTLLVCSVVHEAGHAVAAVREDVAVLGSGFFVLLCLPAAFVDIATAELNAIKKVQQMRIFTAGIWNNLVLSLVAYGLLFSLPLILSPMYKYKSDGVSVIHVESNSSIVGPSGLKLGDVITHVNGCPCKGAQDWQHCLTQADHGPIQSYCIQKPNERDSSEDCCNNSSVSMSSLCFVGTDHHGKRQQRCLKVRTALETAVPCDVAQSHDSCPAPALCLQPELKSPSRLIKVQRRNEKDFLFVGNAAEVYFYSLVTDYVLRFPDSWLSYLFWPSLPSSIELFLYYVASLSAGLAVLNAVPCFMLDGQHIARVIVDGLLPHADARLRSIVLLTVTLFGTILLFSNIIFGIVRLCLS